MVAAPMIRGVDIAPSRMNSTAGRLLVANVDPMAEGVSQAMSNEVRPAVSRRLRAGEWVQVRTAQEILATLDANHCLDGLPFMPEMLQYCGRRFRVFKSAHKTCDTIQSFTIRRMSDAVHLEDLRCDGAAHDGCQAGCLLFWKEVWLRPVAGGDGPEPAAPHVETADLADNITRLHASTRVVSAEAEAPERFRCQATEVRNATSEVRRRDRLNPLFYLRDLTSGNVPLGDFIRFGLAAMFDAVNRKMFGRRSGDLCGRAGGKTPTASLNLQAGDLVQVRSKEAILETLNAQQRNRGLYFDVEMTPFCENGEYKVLKRVERIVDEKTGQMIKIPNACLILDGVTCSGYRSIDRMFCPRAIYPYWREVWLERAANGNGPAKDGETA
jgi:hypothetical protein